MQAVPVRTPELSLSLEQAFPARPRLHSVDLLRGLVMVLMALDTVRAYFSPVRIEPTGLSELSVGLFLTRWVAHPCAPVFVLLAGAGTYLALANGVPRREQARFLAVRGLGLILLELTVVRLLWTFNPDYAGQPLVLHAVAALGVCMIALAGLLALPVTVVAGVGIAIIAGHNLLDGIRAAAFGGAGWLWMFLHDPGMLQPAPGVQMLALYALIPWVGVMAAGYAFGPMMLLEDAQRRRAILRTGIGVTAAFVLVRFANVYGDPQPWAVQDGVLATMLSFINAEKYPPSLAEDGNRLRNRESAMLTLADNTDGIAIVNTNDLAAGMRRIVEDVSAYYLLGYYSTNTAHDGRYRRIDVKLKAPDQRVRARRGYFAPSEGARPTRRRS